LGRRSIPFDDLAARCYNTPST